MIKSLLFTASLLVPAVSGFADPAMVPAASLCDAIAGNLVTNCGFETGTFIDWTTSNLNHTFVAPSGSAFSNTNSGAYFAALGNNGSTGSISQTLADTNGQAYTFGFFIGTDGENPFVFTAEWNGVPLLSLTNTPPFPPIRFSYSVTGTGSDTITFLERNDRGLDALDDVFVVATRVPEPSAGWLLAAAFAAGALLLKRRGRQFVD